MKFRAILMGVIAVLLIASPFLASAQTEHTCTMSDGTSFSIPAEIPCPPTSSTADQNSIYTILSRVIRILFYALMFFAVIMILIAAFSYLTAKGDTEKVEKARSAILYAVIAIAIGVLARSVPFIVSSFVTTNIL